MAKKAAEEIKAKLLADPPRLPVISKEAYLSLGITTLNLCVTGTTTGGVAKGQYLYYVGDSESGKAQPLDAKVLTPVGWVRMGDLQVGNRIIDPDGGTATVLGVYPQGRKPVFRVTFSDKTTTECCDDHLWLTATSRQLVGGTMTVKPLWEIRKSLDERRFYRAYVPVNKAVEFDNGPPLLMDPYLLGLLLGDGCLQNRGVHFSSLDKEILQTIREKIPSGHRLAHYNKSSGDHQIVCVKGQNNHILRLLRKMGLAGKLSQDKFIPPEYLTAGRYERSALLRGLLDTDGTVGRCGRVEYYSTSPFLAEGVEFLARSLGGVATRSIKRTRFVYKGEEKVGLDCYRIALKLPPEVVPFSLSRKALIYNQRGLRIGKKKRIVRVEAVGEKECQCIAVSSKRQLYITDDFIVTHNTWFAMMVLAEAARNPAFDKHALIYDPTEHGAGMDIARYFGNRLLDRIRPPALKGKARPSRTVEEFYFNLDREMDTGPCVYVMDSFDGLTADADDAKFDDDRAEFEKGKLPESGSYRMNKPKAHSQNINRTRQRLVETESVLVGISQTRDAIGSPIPGAKTRSGGKALKFFADVELWTSVRGDIKKTALGKERIIGSFIEVAVRKNRATGWHGKAIPVPFLREHGMDDVGACVDFLIEEKWTKKDGIIKAPEFDFEGKRETLIQRIIKDQDERELQLLVASTWKEIEEACHLERPKRYD